MTDELSDKFIGGNDEAEAMLALLEDEDLKSYNPDQPRDAHGRFGSGGSVDRDAEKEAAKVIYRVEGLDKDQEAMQEKTISDFQANPSKYVDDYMKAHGPKNPEHMGTTVISADLAIDQFPDYAKNNDTRAKYALSVHPVGVRIADMAWKRALQIPVADGHVPEVLFTGGGPGAGKTTGISNVPDMKSLADKAHIVFDGTMSNRSNSKIEAALDNGLKASVVYVHRDIEDAFKNGVIPRAEKTGRTIRTDYMVDSHLAAAKNVRFLQEKYKDNPDVNIHVIDNSRGFGKAKLADSVPDSKRKPEEIRKELDDHVEQLFKDGKITEDCYRGLRSPTSKKYASYQPVDRQGMHGGGISQGAGGQTGGAAKYSRLGQLELEAIEADAKLYNPDQPRDEHGRFSGDGTGPFGGPKLDVPPGKVLPEQTHSLDEIKSSIDQIATEMGGVKDRHDAGTVAEKVAKQYGDDIESIIDNLSKGKRPTFLLNKGDKAKGIPTVWALGWGNGEGTDIHDHAESSAGIHVLRGSVTEKVYLAPKNTDYIGDSKKEAGIDVREHEHDVGSGSTMTIPAPYIHEVSGHMPDFNSKAITVHAYYPPLKSMNYFTKDAKGNLHHDGDWDEDRPPSEFDKPRKCCCGMSIKEWTKEFNPDQARDEHGRWSGAGATHLSEMMDRIHQPDGGFTYDPLSDKEPTEGYVVSPFPDRSFGKPAIDLTPKDATDFINKNMDLLKQKGNMLGGWNDPRNGQAFLDIVKTVKDETEAKALASKHDQIAYFDLKNGKSIMVNPNATSGGAAKGKKKDKVRLTIASGQFTAEKVAKLFEKLTGRKPSDAEFAEMEKELAK